MQPSSILDSMYFVYILLCSDGTYYTGCTSDLAERLTRHEKGYVEYTQSRLPVELVYFSSFRNQQKAFSFEKYLKSGSGIAFRNKHLI
ncbi:MAG: GIY-YIG nuclease family protein [Cyclobacteriaceae bacterium]|nr:GIY-YIG nuclease family protein [Cyclobacteriaceae bacterium]